MAPDQLDELVEFLTIAERQGYLNEHTAQARRTACSKLFSILEPEQRTVEYVRNNLESIRTRFQNLNREVRGGTVEEYGRRVSLVIEDYMLWNEDRAGWERNAGSKGAKPASSEPTEKKAKARTEKASRPAEPSTAPDGRPLSFPLRPDFELKMHIPKDGLTVGEIKKLMYFLLPYAKDWEPASGSAQQVFSALEGNRTGTGG